MAPTARRAHGNWAATRITALIGLVFRMLWSVATGLKFLVFLVTPLPQLRKAAHFVQTTASRARSIAGNPSRMQSDPEDIREWAAKTQELMKHRPVAQNPDGLAACLKSVREQFEGIEGFTVEIVPSGVEGCPPVLVATLEVPSMPTVGISGHYDVEEVDGNLWHRRQGGDPFELCMSSPSIEDGASVPSNVPCDALSSKRDDGVRRDQGTRAYGRGVGDNLGPLVTRIIAIRRARAAGTSLPSIVWVLHGDEETGSAGAHKVYAKQQAIHARVDVWVEETGFFVEGQAVQRILFRNRSPMLDHCIVAVKALAYKNGLTVEMQDRFMNKNGGIEGCPMLTHLVKDSPYIAIGLNDTITGIHQPNESIDVNRISLAIQQFTEFLHAAATASV